jgi:hypothetical protein
MAVVVIVVIVVIIVLSIALLAVSGAHLRYRRRGTSRLWRTSARRILFPYVADGLSRQTLDAALRLASAEDATLVPVFLARVPLHLPIDTPCPRQSAVATALQTRSSTPRPRAASRSTRESSAGAPTATPYAKRSPTSDLTESCSQHHHPDTAG